MINPHFLETFNSLEIPIQCREEWLAFLEYCAAYFEHRGITQPLVLEIGTRLNQQKAFYEKLLGARHIGIDITDAEGKPDVLGDSSTPETLDKVKALIGDEPIDLLFIDGCHDYMAVMRDYGMYACLTKHIIAFHDIKILYEGFGIKQFWDELKAYAEKDYTFISFDSWTEPTVRLGYAMRLGIGIAIRKGT